MLLLPCIAYYLLFRIFRNKGLEWRQAALTAAVFCGTSVVLFTEALSLPKLLSRGPLSLCWLGLCVAAFYYLKTTKGKPAESSIERGSSAAPLDRTTKVLLVGTGIIVVFVAITALASPPNVWDAMEYHLPRTIMWMSNHSVRFYATPDFNQLILGPWAEFAMLHTELLWGSDRFVNMIEFLSFLGSVIAASLIAKMLGAGPRGQTFAAIVCATIPEGILEASGSMNTYVGAFWIASTIVFSMNWNENPTWLNTVCTGLSVGIAALTKGTSYIWLPFVVVGCWWMASKAQWIRFVKVSPIILAIILAVNAPQYVRNYEATGSPLAVPLPDFPRLQLTITHLGVTRTLANAIRNVSLHLGTPSQRVNDRIEGVLRATIRGMGSDADDPEATWLGGPFVMSHSSFHEVHAGNPLHLALLMLSLAIILWKGRSGSGGRRVIFSIGLIAAFFFFSAVVRWAEWSSRYQMPFFVLGAGLVGFVFETYFNRKLAHTVLLLLIVCGLPFALFNRTRSLISWSRVADIYHPREYLYFTDQHEAIAQVNMDAAAAIQKSDCGDIAIDSYVESAVGNTPISFYVYPMLALLHVDGNLRRVSYSGVNNRSSHYGEWQIHRKPCAVICLDCARVPTKWVEYKDVDGQPQVFDYIVVFSKSEKTLTELRGK